MTLYKSSSAKACLLCPNRSNVTDGKTDDPLQRITYHKLPVTAERRDRWLEFCGHTIQSFPSLGFKFVCSNHFEPEWFERDLRSELLHGIKRMILKKDAIPTIRTNGQQLTRMVQSQTTDEEERKMRKAEVEKLLTGEISSSAPIVNPFRKHLCDDRPKAKRKPSPGPPGNATISNDLIRVLPRLSETEMLQRIAQLEQETGDQGKLIARLQRTIDEKTEKINFAKAEMVNIVISLQAIKDHENRHVNERVTELLSSRFSEGQLAMITANSTVADATAASPQLRWSTDDLTKALELRCISEDAFDYVKHRLNYPLPDSPQLERWIHGVYLETGLNEAGLRLLQLHASSKNPIELICTLNLVRMDAPVRYHYDRTRDQIVGPSAQINCIALQGIFSEWMQIVHTEFDLIYSSQLLEQIVAKLHRVGYLVVAITTGCDNYMEGVWHVLGVNYEQNFILHPVTGNPVYVFVCQDRILSAIHRILVDDGFVMQQNNVTITKDVLARLLESVNPRIVNSLKIGHQHLSSEILDDPFNATNSRQLLSHSTSNALKILAFEATDDDIVSTLGTLFDIIIDWYELCTAASSSLVQDQQQHPTSITRLPYGACEDEQNIVLDGMCDVMENVRCLSAENNYLPEGILISINSMRKLLADLRRDYPGQIDDIPIHRLGSTPISNVMIKLQATLNNANGVGMLSVNEVLGHLCHAVACDSHGSHITNSLLQLGHLSGDIPTDTVRPMNQSTDPDVSGVTEQNACSFLTHFIAAQLGHKYDYLGEQTIELESKNNQYVLRPSSKQMEGIVKPSVLWTEQAKRLESFMHDDVVQQQKPAMVENLVNYVHNVHPRMGRDLVETYVRKRIAIKLQMLNAELDSRDR